MTAFTALFSKTYAKGHATETETCLRIFLAYTLRDARFYLCTILYSFSFARCFVMKVNPGTRNFVVGNSNYFLCVLRVFVVKKSLGRAFVARQAPKKMTVYMLTKNLRDALSQDFFATLRWKNLRDAWPTGGNASVNERAFDKFSRTRTWEL